MSRYLRTNRTFCRRTVSQTGRGRLSLRSDGWGRTVSIQRVAYLLGAGFSAPLGLPVMSNFLAKAKDLYFEDQERYEQSHEEFFRT